MSDWKVELVHDSVGEFTVEFKGPPDSECYESVSSCMRPEITTACAHCTVSVAQALMREASGESEWSCQMPTRTNPHQ